MGQPDIKRNTCNNNNTTLHARSRFHCPPSPSAWFDIRVFYIRVMRCIVSEAPQLLTMCFPVRNFDVVLEINGGRISPAEDTCIALRRDRVDVDSEEVTYVSTDNLRISGRFLAFEIYDKHDFLVFGSLKQQQQSSSPFEGMFPSSMQEPWKMDCNISNNMNSESILKSNLSFRGRNSSSSRHEFSKLLGTCVEVYVVGRYIGTPVILTQNVHLNVNHRRNQARCAVLGSIPEDEECGNNDKQVPQVLGTAGQYDEDDDDDDSSVVPAFNKLYTDNMQRGDGSEGDEDGEIVSWFNAGVRVGVGIGLGMCLGVGIGVGLLVRTYNATAKSFRRL